MGKGLNEKFLEIQKRIDVILKDGENKNDKYDYVSGSAVLSIIRPCMNELGLLLIPKITERNVIEGQTRSGTARFVVELVYDFVWIDVESGETLIIPWYSNGADLGSAERAVGKALTYGEKYLFLKMFHIPTDKDDPDNDGRTKKGELRQRGTQAQKENLDYYRAAIPQMLNELYGGDAEKVKGALVAMTKNDSRGFAGVGDVAKLSAAALPVAYAKVKKTYETRLGKEFELKQEDAANAND